MTKRTKRFVQIHNKDLADQETHEYYKQYETLSDEIDEIRKAKQDLLKGANLPLPGLSVEDGELTYQGGKSGTT